MSDPPIREDAAPEPVDVPGLQSVVEIIAGYVSTGDAKPRTDLIDRLSSRQFDKLIENDREAAERRDVYKTAALKANVVVICVVVAILFLCWMFLAYKQTEVLKEVVAYLIGLASGGGIGYVVRGRHESDTSE